MALRAFQCWRILYHNITLLFQLFASELSNEHAPVPGDGTPPSPYVFPAAQSQYARNKNRIFQAVKPVFARAVFGDVEPESDVGDAGRGSTTSATGRAGDVPAADRLRESPCQR